MAITLVQQNSGSSSGVGVTTVSAIFGSAPTIGNLMVATLFTNSDINPPNPSGWTTAVEVVNSNNLDYLRILSRVVQSGDSSTVTITGLEDNAAQMLGIFEYAGLINAAVDRTATTGRTPGVTSLSTGTTPTTTASEELIIAAVAIRAVISAPSFNNSVTLQHSLTVSNISLIDGYRFVSSTGAYTTTGTWTTAGDSMAAIATFKATLPGNIRDVATRFRLAVPSTAVRRTTCVLGWDAPTTDQGGGALTGLADYQVFVSQTSGVYGAPAATITAPTLTATGLALNLPVGLCYVTVKARDPVPNTSLSSNELVLTVASSTAVIHHHRQQQ